MKYSTGAALSALLFTSSVLAVPFAEGRRNGVDRRNVRRSTRRLQSKPINTAELTPNKEGKYMTSSGTKTFSGSGPGGWGGAVVGNIQSATAVQATMVVPTPSIPPGGSSGVNYGGAAWVGIDGDGDCSGGLWQTGVQWNIEGTQQAFSGWYEWIPQGSMTFENFTVSAGDTVSMQVVASSSSSGTAYLTNESTGQSVSQFLSGQSGLCMEAIEFIVEDYGVSGSSIPFAGFSPEVTFSGASWTDSSGNSHGVSGATIVEVGQDGGQPFTNCGVSGSSTVTCSYTGNAADS